MPSFICVHILLHGLPHPWLPLWRCDGLSVAFVKRSFKLWGHQLITNTGLSTTNFILFDTWRMGRWFWNILLVAVNQGDKSSPTEFYLLFSFHSILTLALYWFYWPCLFDIGPPFHHVLGWLDVISAHVLFKYNLHLESRIFRNEGLGRKRWWFYNDTDGNFVCGDVGEYRLG